MSRIVIKLPPTTILRYMDRAAAIPLFVSGLVFVDLRDDTLSIVELDEIGDGSAMSKARNCRSIEDRLGEVAHLGHPFVTFHVVGYPHKPMCHCQKYGGEKLFTERCQHDEVMLNSIVRSINRTDVSFRREVATSCCLCCRRTTSSSVQVGNIRGI